LSRAECRPAGGAGSRAERLAALRKRCDSDLEKRWLSLVDGLMLRLPSDAQYKIPGYFTQPDFFYSEFNAAIYVDGPPHDQADQIREDDATTKALMNMGYIVIRFHHMADWLTIFRKHPDIFGSPRP
jgi:very-short-patch-repair endonuclease